MSLAASRKLRFTRHDITQSQFSPFLSLYRLKNIRNLMRQKQCDAFLIVLGVDSKFNCGSLQVASYLLFDMFESRKADMNRSKFDVEIFEDLIILLQPNETHLYCNSVNYQLLLPYISHWPNLRIHCVSEAEMANLDKYEEYKMNTFKKITKDCKRIAIAYTDQHGNPQTEFNKMMIEDWPIVQSYAFDTTTQSSQEFFTLSREIVNVSQEVQQLIILLDPVFIETTLIRYILTFTGTVEAVYRLMDAYVESEDQSNKAKLLEPLMSTYLYAHSTGDKNDRILPPYVLFGKDTTKQNILSESIKRKCIETTEFSTTSHMVIRGCAHPNRLVCERTCFFQPPELPGAVVDIGGQRSRKLMEIYRQLLQVMWDFIEELKNTSLPLETLLLKAQETLNFRMHGHKHGGTELKLSYPDKSNSHAVNLAVLSGAVYDLTDEKTGFLGSVVVADTLIISTLKMNRTLISRNVVNLTASIHHICSWIQSSAPVRPEQYTKNRKPALFDEPMDLVITPMNVPGLLTANCAWSEDGIVIYGKRLGISYLDPVRVLHYRPIDIEKPELLEIIMSQSASSLHTRLAAPIQLALRKSTFCASDFNKSRDQEMNIFGSSTEKENLESIWILLKPRTRVKRLFLDQVAPVWRSQGILHQTENPPIPSAMRASLVATFLAHDGLNNATELKASAVDLSDFPRQFSLNQLMTQQLSNDVWLQIHRADLHHIEASCCLNTLTPGASSILEYALRCGLTYKHQANWQTAESSDVIAMLRKVLEYSDEERDGRGVWIRDLQSNELNGTLKDENDSDPEHSHLSQTSNRVNHLAAREPFVMTVVCGPIGSRKEVVMRNVMQMVKEETQWIAMEPNTVNDLATALRTGLAEWGKISLSHENGPKRLRGLLLCPGVCGAREVLSVITQLHREEGQSVSVPPIRIGCVVTCIDVRCALMDSGRFTFPGVLELISEGWTNYLLHTGPPKAKQVVATKFGVQIDEVERLLRSVNPRLSQLSAPDGHTSHGNVLEALLDENAFDEIALQRARLLSYPNLILAPSGPRLQSVTLRFSRPLDRGRLTNGLKSLFTNLNPWPFHGNIYTVRGHVAFTNEDHKQFEVFHNTLSGISRIGTVTQVEDVTPTEGRPYWLTGTLAAAQGNEKEDDSIVSRFANWIRQAGPQQEELKPPICRSDLTSEDLEKIHHKYHLRPLPPGWYYTGVYYVNMNGEKSFQHPNMDAFIAEYVEGENNKIAARNARISRHPIPDLFSDSI